MQNLDKSTWREISLLVIEHGRNICKAQKPKCEECLLKTYCAYYMSEVSGQKFTIYQFQLGLNALNTVEPFLLSLNQISFFQLS